MADTHRVAQFVWDVLSDVSDVSKDEKYTFMCGSHLYSFLHYNVYGMVEHNGIRLASPKASWVLFWYLQQQKLYSFKNIFIKLGYMLQNTYDVNKLYVFDGWNTWWWAIFIVKDYNFTCLYIKLNK